MYHLKTQKRNSQIASIKMVKMIHLSLFHKKRLLATMHRKTMTQKIKIIKEDFIRSL